MATRCCRCCRTCPKPPVLIVVATLARAMGDGDENSGQDMGALIRTLDRIRAATGAHVMAVHHAGKDTSKGARGHSSLRAAVDTEVQVTRDGMVITAQTRKQRDMDGSRSLTCGLLPVDLGHDEDGDPVMSCVTRLTEPLPPAPPKLTGQPAIAMQALGDALARHGRVMFGDMFPQNRQAVSLDVWREYCDRHSLSTGDAESSKRAAFYKTRSALHEKGLICIIDGHFWRVSE